jgi:hypothetical protein
MAWTDEKRKLVVDSYVTTMETEYTTDEDRAKSSVEVVKDLADTHGETPNGVRQMLSSAGVYIKATPAKSKSTTPATGTGGTRVNKAEAIQTLRNLILQATESPESLDEDILGKMTGKAAQYFAGILLQATGS